MRRAERGTRRHANVTLALQGSWKVLLTSLVLGAGLPLIFALGITFIVATGFGRALSSEHVYPTIVPK